MAEEVKEEVKEKKGGKKKLLIFILLGFLIIGIAGAGVFVFLGKKGEEAAESKKGKKSAKPKVTFFIEYDPIIVNLMDPSGKRYLQVRMSFEVADKKVEEELKKKEPLIKDLVLSILSGKTVEEVVVPDAKEKIKAEILKKVNEALGEELVLNVYITQFIVE
ncbi:flagellar basal body protein FliL [Caldimicrobium thiodismutans]|uniref:Flagellar protein FliL n=1 Tax=Caldimicrobium thiodismutans TaxID=1653476 RepID=A0A0U5AYD3_9BACT|nr:flagellar basal body-associated FliL family protein [Caldimicrobium thiodismutans]BAU22745.1 flagellar basal body protein FliL [Caldimicrobium thiodismutans]